MMRWAKALMPPTCIPVVALVALFAGCSEDSAPGLLVWIKTDMAPGTEISYLRVDSLDTQGEQYAYSQWFTVKAGCPTDPTGMTYLGSLGVARGERELARLRVLAFRTNADAQAEEIIEQRVDAVFQRGTLPVSITLAKVCSDRDVCDEGATCDPATGVCRDVSKITASTPGPQSTLQGCMQVLNAPPLLAPPVTEASSATCARDGICSPECGWSRDVDCPHNVGDPCNTSAQCVSTAFCVQGFCCDQPCGDPCSRCDLPGRAGRCSPLQYGSTEPPLGKIDILLECARDHVRVRCAAGSCGPSCYEGYGDCDSNLQQNGCETPIATADNCAFCGDQCTYGYCDGGSCPWHNSNALNTDASWLAAPGSIYAAPLVRTSGDLKIRALGALVDSVVPGTRLRLGLYKLDATGAPSGVVQQTEDLVVQDNASSKVDRPQGAIRVEGMIPPVDYPVDALFFLAVTLSTTTEFFGANTTPRSWYVAPYAYGELPYTFPPNYNLQDIIPLSLYAITTPE